MLQNAHSKATRRGTVMDPADRTTTEALQQQLEVLDAHYQETLAHTAALAHQVQQ